MTRIEYERLSGITYEQELEILAEIYRLALESYRKRKENPGADQSVRGNSDGTKTKGDSADARIVPK